MISKIDPPKVEKYSKTNGGLFKITLLAYSQQGWKSDPETPHLGEVFGTKIDPISRKSGFEIITKIKSFFKLDFWWILAPFWTPRATQKWYIFLLFSLLWSLLRHLGAKRAPKVLQDSPEGRFYRIFFNFGDDFGAIFDDFPCPSY